MVKMTCFRRAVVQTVSELLQRIKCLTRRFAMGDICNSGLWRQTTSGDKAHQVNCLVALCSFLGKIQKLSEPALGLGEH